MAFVFANLGHQFNGTIYMKIIDAEYLFKINLLSNCKTIKLIIIYKLVYLLEMLL
jgi:hypothetical protein